MASSPKHLLHECFDVIDVDGGGSIGFNEFKTFNAAQANALDEDELRKLFKDVDADGSGEIDKGEFEALVTRLVRIISTPISDMAEAFEKKCYSELFQLVGDGARALSAQDFRGMVDSVNNQLNLGHSSEDIRKIFKRYDEDRDGSIELNEFEEVMRIMKGKSTISTILHAFNKWKQQARERMTRFKKAFGESNDAATSPLGSPTHGGFRRQCKECEGLKAQVAALERMKNELEAQLAEVSAPPSDPDSKKCEHCESHKRRAETADRQATFVQLKLDQVIAAQGTRNCVNCEVMRSHVTQLEQENREQDARYRKEKKVAATVKTKAEELRERAVDMETRLQAEIARSQQLEAAMRHMDDKLKKAMALKRRTARAASPPPSSYEMKDYQRKLEMLAAALGIRTQSETLLRNRLKAIDERLETRMWLDSLAAEVRTASRCALGGDIDSALNARGIRVPLPDMNPFGLNKNDMVSCYTAVREYRIAHNEPRQAQASPSPRSTRRQQRMHAASVSPTSQEAALAPSVRLAPSESALTEPRDDEEEEEGYGRPRPARQDPHALVLAPCIFADPEGWLRSPTSRC